jgi:hypothetical protein
VQTLFYSSLNDGNVARLSTAVHQAISKGRVEPFKNIDDFEERLRRPVEPASIAVLFAASRAELRRLQPLRSLLTEIFIVLVIPDRTKGTIELAHLLLPRFFCLINDDFDDLGKVLQKIAQTVR